MKVKPYIFLFGVFIFSCSPRLSFFTTDMSEKFNWTTSDIQNIQFYLSDDIVLRRELNKGESVIAEGKVRIEEGKEIEEIIFREGTPGVLLFSPKEDRMAISFGEGSDQYLMFGATNKSNGKFRLLAADWNRHEGLITYNGKKYSTPSRSSFAALLIDISEVRRTDYQQKVVKGRTL